MSLGSSLAAVKTKQFQKPDQVNPNQISTPLLISIAV